MQHITAKFFKIGINLSFRLRPSNSLFFRGTPPLLFSLRLQVPNCFKTFLEYVEGRYLALHQVVYPHIFGGKFKNSAVGQSICSLLVFFVVVQPYLASRTASPDS